MELAAAVLDNSEDGGVFSEGGGLVGGESGREAMEDGVVSVEDLERSGDEFGGVPVEMSWKNRRLGLRVDPYDVGFDR